MFTPFELNTLSVVCDCAITTDDATASTGIQYFIGNLLEFAPTGARGISLPIRNTDSKVCLSSRQQIISHADQPPIATPGSRKAPSPRCTPPDLAETARPSRVSVLHKRRATPRQRGDGPGT